MKRLSSTTWVLLIISGIGAAVIIDTARSFLAAPPPPPTERDLMAQYTPPFKLGDVAPDFTLPDVSGKGVRFSSLIKRKTLLCFTCGCARCRHTQEWLVKAMKALGNDAPDVVTVTSQTVHMEEAYRRDVPLKQTILYDANGDTVMEEYKGHPCPRLFGLTGDRRVEWIGLSLAQPGLTSAAVVTEAALHLGFDPPSYEPHYGRKMPPYDPGNEMPTGMIGPTGAGGGVTGPMPPPGSGVRAVPPTAPQEPGGIHGPDDGHGHGKGDGHGH